MILCGLAFPLGASEEKPAQSIPELEQAIRAVLIKTKTPGAGLAVVQRDKVLWVAGLGKADVAANRDATPDTPFRIGSVAKGLVGLAILKLVEQGKLSLTDEVHRLVPEIQFENRWEATDPVRVVNLLDHTTGFDDWSLRDYANDDPKPLTLKEGLDFDPAARVCRWKPGTRFAYCNTGPPLAAYIVEKISGQRYEDFLEQNFFRPLQMEPASFFLTPYMQTHLSQLYLKDGVTPVPYQHNMMRPAGALNVSPREMANYVRFYLNRGSLDGRKILEPASLDRMETPTSLWAARQGMRFGYGLCNYTDLTPQGFLSHGHEGGLPGAQARCCYFPEQGVGYMMVINTHNNEAYTAINQLLTRFLLKDFPAPSLPAPAKIPVDMAAHYTGFYEPISPRNKITRWDGWFLGLIQISFQGDALSKRGFYSRTSTKMVAVTDRFYRSENLPLPTLALVPDEGEGTILQDQAAWTTYRKIPTGRLVSGLAMGILCGLGMISSVAFAGIWIPRKILGMMPDVRHLSLRAIPLLASICFALAYFLYFQAYKDMPARLIVCSEAFFLLAWFFAFLTVWGGIQLLRIPRQEVHPSIWWHSFFVILMQVVTVGYLVYWGILGSCAWA